MTPQLHYRPLWLLTEHIRLNLGPSFFLMTDDAKPFVCLLATHIPSFMKCLLYACWPFIHPLSVKWIFKPFAYFVLFILRNNSVIHNCNVKITEEKKKHRSWPWVSKIYHRTLAWTWLWNFFPLEEEMRPRTEQAKFSSLPLTEAPDIWVSKNSRWPLFQASFDSDEWIIDHL